MCEREIFMIWILAIMIVVLIVFTIKEVFFDGELFFYDYQTLLDNYSDDKQVEDFKKFIPKEILETCS